MAESAAPSDSGDHSGVLLVGTMCRRFFHTGIDGPRAKYQVPGFPTVLYFGPDNQARPDRAAFRRTGCRRRTPGDRAATHPRTFTHCLRTPGWIVLRSPDAILISGRSLNMGRDQWVVIFFLCLLALEILPQSRWVLRYGRPGGDLFSAIFPFLFARTDFRPRTSLLQRGVSGFSFRQRLAGGSGPGFAGLQASVPGGDSSGSAFFLRVESFGGACRLSPRADRPHVDVFWYSRHAHLFRYPLACPAMDRHCGARSVPSPNALAAIFLASAVAVANCGVHALRSFFRGDSVDCRCLIEVAPGSS